MNIDFSMSIEDWMKLFEELFAIVTNFFKRIGIEIFEEETTAAAEESTAVTLS